MLGNEKITEFTVSVGNGDGFSFGSFTLINPNDPPDGETGVKHRHYIVIILNYNIIYQNEIKSLTTVVHRQPDQI